MKGRRHALPIRAAASAALFGLLGLVGCAEFAYHVGQASQAEQCRRLPPGTERQRCEAQAESMSYERYRSEADAARAREAK